MPPTSLAGQASGASPVASVNLPHEAVNSSPLRRAGSRFFHHLKKHVGVGEFPFDVDKFAILLTRVAGIICAVAYFDP